MYRDKLPCVLQRKRNTVDGQHEFMRLTFSLSFLLAALAVRFMIFTIAGKELKALFASPLAWVVLTVVQIIIGYAFLRRLDDFLQLQPQLAQHGEPARRHRAGGGAPSSAPRRRCCCSRCRSSRCG